ncbi:MAG: hypothetical protein AB1758_31640 [Candidatus Eremiobacterota bacterium]
MRTLLILFLLLCLPAVAEEVSRPQMQREARWLHSSAEKLYTCAGFPFGPQWQMSPAQQSPQSFLRAAERFELAWLEPGSTLATTRPAYDRLRNAYDKVKVYARVNMNAQESIVLERTMDRLDTLYGVAREH